MNLLRFALRAAVVGLLAAWALWLAANLYIVIAALPPR